MQTECQTYCSKSQNKVDSYPGPKLQDTDKIQRSGTNKSIIINNRRSPSQSQKSVHIGGVTSVEITDSYRKGLRDTKSNVSERTTSARDYGKDSRTGVSGGASVASENSPRVPVGNGKPERTNDPVGSANRSQKKPPIQYGRMSARDRASPAESGSQDPEWNSDSHDPCPPTCPMTAAREQAIRKAKLRQERLDDYLVNKGFRYFDDLCTCSSICLIKQLQKDKFVRDILKSACFFALGVKLCEELDFWNLFG